VTDVGVMHGVRDGRTSGSAPWRAAGRLALIGAAFAGAFVGVRVAEAQQPASPRGRTVLMPSMASGGPCDATMPMRDAASGGDARRRVTATMRELTVLETTAPAGEADPDLISAETDRMVDEALDDAGIVR